MAHSTLLYLIVEAVCYLVPDDDADAAVVQALDDGQELQKQVLRGATGAQQDNLSNRTKRRDRKINVVPTN